MLKYLGMALAGFGAACLWWWPLVPLPEEPFFVALYVAISVSVAFPVATMEFISLLNRLFGDCPAYISTYVKEGPVENAGLAIFLFPFNFGYSIGHSFIPVLGWFIQLKKAELLINEKAWLFTDKFRRLCLAVVAVSFFLATYVAFHAQPRYPKQDLTGKWGFASKHGWWVISPQFDNIRSFDGKIAPFCRDNKWGFIDLHGAVCQEPLLPSIGFWSFMHFSNPNSRIPFFNGEKWGFKDESLNWRISPIFDEIKPFSQNYYTSWNAAVKRNGKWGYIRRDGTTMIEPQFDKAFSFSAYSGRLALVWKEGQPFYILSNGSPDPKSVLGDFSLSLTC